MAYVPYGKVLIGDDSNLDDERPSHHVSTSDYFIDVHEVTIWDWEKVATWAEANGYQFSDAVKRKDSTGVRDRSSLLFPMNMTNWYDAVKWCNARSELEGRTPVYFEDPTKRLFTVRETSTSMNPMSIGSVLDTDCLPKSNGNGRRVVMLPPPRRITVGGIHF